MDTHQVARRPPTKPLCKEDVATLHRNMKSEDWSTDTLYSEIEKGINGLFRDNELTILTASVWDMPPSKQPRAPTDPETNRIEELKKILDFDEDADTRVRRTELLQLTIKKRSKSLHKYDKDKQDPKGPRRQAIAICISYMIVKALCSNDPRIAFKIDDNGFSGFQIAAKEGSDVLLEMMMEELEQSNAPKDEVLELISKPCKNQSLIKLAVDGPHFKVIKALVEKDSSLADVEVLYSILKELKDTEDKSKLAGQKQASEIFTLIFQANPSYNNSELWRQAVLLPSTEAVRILLTGTGSDRYATHANAEVVIRAGNSEMWNLFRKEDRDKFMTEPRCNLLHLAVSERQLSCVKAILSEYPNQINATVIDGNAEMYAMHRLKDKKRIMARDDALRTVLLHALIRSPKLNIRQIKQILKESDASLMTLSFPNLEGSQVTFAEYMDSVKRRQESIYNFEAVLKHISFPELDRDGPPVRPEDWKLRHNEIDETFQWLKNRGVKTVLSLSVLDRLHCPHSDDDVQKCVEGKGVQVLNWRKPDLYLGNLHKKQDDRSELRVLHLYSSGKRAVIDHWYRELPQFPNLTKVYINVIEDIMDEDRARSMALEIRERFKEVHQQMITHWESTATNQNKNVGSEEPTLVVSTCAWTRGLRDSVPISMTDNTSEIVGPNLNCFIGAFRSYHSLNSKTRKTKVALIDSGVVVYGGNAGSERQPGNKFGIDLAERVVEGTSLTTKDNEDDVCWHPSDPHGTQMAQLICSIDPCCELYVAKVTGARGTGVSANNVADAIDWAISRDVDIISLSLVTLDVKGERLSRAIRKAKNRDIVVMTSTADSGHRKMETITSKDRNSSDLISIAACSNTGQLLEDSQPDGYHYSFLGNVRVNPVPTLRSEHNIRGSSVATAIASGLAALTVACCRISKRCATNGEEEQWRFRMVWNTFYDIAQGSAGKVPWVDTERFCCKNNELAQRNFHFESTVNENFIL